jgi:hypothetical protein
MIHLKPAQRYADFEQKTQGAFSAEINDSHSGFFGSKQDD